MRLPFPLFHSSSPPHFFVFLFFLYEEYDVGPLDKQDYVDISTENDSFYCRPTRKNVITKLSFATEELYQRSLRQKKERRKVGV